MSTRALVYARPTAPARWGRFRGLGWIYSFDPTPVMDGVRLITALRVSGWVGWFYRLCVGGTK